VRTPGNPAPCFCAVRCFQLMPGAGVMQVEQQQRRPGPARTVVSWGYTLPLPCRLEEYLKTYKKCLVLVSHSQARGPARGPAPPRRRRRMRAALCESRRNSRR